ncbi:MAG: hypothetical protein DI555_06935 [Novosphingobium pentaromativorans]|uniref:DUF551 domain-containing protein n=1 Tax=Novosphingobium pentaromativorans TaxID=205844 RepID=A0A2W5NZ11_9SPHN|nr:MAG: hypothetical protein DI555_06935 [Novosphingobium pentaromativorans]
MTPSPETKTMTEKLKATYEARYCPGIPTDCCDYGVISHETGKEVCRVWDRDDVERITSLLNTRHPTPAADEVEAEVLDLLFQIDNVDPAEIAKSPSYIKETARAAIAALQARSAEPRVERWRKASIAMGTWLSAAYDDPDVCDAMKADIREWFSAGEPFENMAAEPAGEEPDCATCRGYRYVVMAPSAVSAGGEHRPCPVCNGAVTFGNATPPNPERLVEGWRPIDSAPKDGWKILATDRVHRERTWVVWWKGNEWVCDHHDGSVVGLTDWMPLPAAPLKEGQGE